MKAFLILFSLLMLIYPSRDGLENTTWQPSEISNWNPSWSPDGTSIAFTSDRSGNKDLWTMTSDGKNPTNLTAQNPFAEFSPNWSPDGNSIAYVVQSISEQALGYNLDLWLIEPNGENNTNLTAPLFTDGIIANDSPAWSPDGDRIVFISTDRLLSKVIAFNLHDSTFTTIAQSDNKLWAHPSWAPDGDLIAFVAYSDNPGLWVTTADDDDPQEIVTNEVRDFSWSPDGTRIVFTSILDKSFENLDIDLMIIDLNSSEVVNLTDNLAGSEVEAMWSPHSERIVFRATVNGVTDIWSINADGTALFNLTSDEAEEWAPTWSPDGTRVAYMSDRAGTLDIWVMNADGTNPVNLTGDG